MDKFAEQNKILNDAPHSYYANLISITRNLPYNEALAQLAEEASELSQAALKVRRTLGFMNPTPVPKNKALENLIEEIADTMLCLDVVMMSDPRLDNPDASAKLKQFKEEKAARWWERMEITMKEHDHESRTDD